MPSLCSSFACSSPLYSSAALCVRRRTLHHSQDRQRLSSRNRQGEDRSMAALHQRNLQHRCPDIPPPSQVHGKKCVLHHHNRIRGLRPSSPDLLHSHPERKIVAQPPNLPTSSGRAPRLQEAEVLIALGVFLIIGFELTAAGCPPTLS